MRNNTKKVRNLLVTILIAILLLSLAACGSGNGATSSPSGSGESTVSQTERETKDLQGREIRMFIYGFDRTWMENDINGQRTLNRFAEIEQKFNCTLKILSGPKDTTNEAIWATIIAGNPSADLVDGAGPHLIAQPVSNNLYMDLNSLSVFDWSDPKWNKGIMDLLDINGKQYGCTVVGDETSRYMLNNVMFFNKGLVQQAGYNPDDIYQWQKDKAWTWEKFAEVAEAVSKLSTADNQIYGSISNDLRLYSGLVTSMGARWISLDDRGVPVFSADTPEALEALEFYRMLFNKKIIPDSDEYNDQKKFTAGIIGFLPDYLDKVNNKTLNMAGMKDDYGIVLFPKYGPAEDYVSFVDWFGFWAIPTGIKDPGDIALVINYMTDPIPDAPDPQVLFESYVKDEGSLDVFGMLKDRTVIIPTFMSNPVCRLWQGQLGLILRGTKTPAEALAEFKSQYEAEIAKAWDIS